jgi:TolB-like protein
MRFRKSIFNIMFRRIVILIPVLFWCNYVFPLTLAVSYFDNNSELTRYNSLSKGIADMLITDLSKVEGVTIVERAKLESLLNEIKLGQTKYFDQATAQKLGKGLGAETILTGAFLVVGNEMRIDARLIDVETSKILMSEEVNGPTTNFFALHSELVSKLSKSLKIPRQQVNAIEAGYKPVALDAVLAYSDAIDINDQGLGKDAVELLQTTVEKYPEFVQAKSKLDDLKAWLAEMEKKREAMISAEIERIMKELSSDDPNLNMKINNHWSTLVSSNNYSQILVFNDHLVDLGLDLDSRMFGETTPLTFGEMLLYYNCLAYAQLNRYQEEIEYGRQFIEKYPASMYYLAVKTWLEKAHDELKARKDGKLKVKEAMKKGRFEVYMDYLDVFGRPYVLKFIDDTKKNEFENACMSEVIPYLKELNEAPDNFFNNDLEDLFETAMKFNQSDLMQEIIEIAFRFYSGTDEEEEAYDLEDAYNEYVEEQLETDDKRKEYLEKIKNTPVEEYDKIIQSGYQIRKSGLYDELKDVCIRFIENSDGKDPEEVGRYVYRAWDNLFDVLNQLGEVEEFETWLDKCKTDETLIAYEKDNFDKIIRNFESDLRGLRADKSEYTNNLINYPLELKLNMAYATIYNEAHQYPDVIKLRSKIIKEYPLDENNLSLQYYYLFMAYREYGMFDEAGKVYEIMQQSMPDNTYTTSLAGLVNVLPR